MVEKNTRNSVTNDFIGESEQLRVNIMAQDMALLVYKNQITSLKETLDRFHIPEYLYSILAEKDETSCMTYADSEWSVYYSERGQKTNLRKAGDVADACCILLRDMAEDEGEYHQMLEYFRHQMDERASIHPTSAELHTAVQASLAKIARAVAL